MALAMKVISQVEAQRKILEEAVSTALELASGKSDGAEVAVSKTTGISVSTRYGEVENVEFNSDGALGITVYHQNRKGSASSTDLSPQAIARTVQAALDIARYTSPDPCAGVADKELLAFDAPDLDLFHPAEVSPDEAIELAARAEQAALQADKRITNTEGGSFNSHYGVKVFGNSHGMLQGYCSTRHSLSSCVIAEENGDMERDYAYTIGRAMSDLQTPEWVGADCARRTLSRLSPRKLSTMKAPVIFANEVATGLFGHLVGAIAGGSVYRKSTFLLDSLGKLAGAKTEAKGAYPGWQPDANSPVMHLVRETYQRLFNKTPNIQIIHAGLECGLFKKPYPEMDMVSIGPTITGPHSPDEQVHIESVGHYWTLLTELLKEIPAK